MSSSIATLKQSGEMVTAEHAESIRSALKTSLYPGASDASVDMVLAYCRAAALDPMTKPVHIVPMQVSTGQKDSRGFDVKEKRDIVMPGIGLYRINAARTGEYAGCSEPEFGPTVTMNYSRDVWTDGPNGKRQKSALPAQLEYPEWCRVTVTRIVDGKECRFSAKEYWLENYAEKGDSGGPNAMWEKRPFGQLAKCTEAQALRKAFPEAVGSQPTVDEMEGKELRTDAAASQPHRIERDQPAELPQYPQEDFDVNLPAWRKLIQSGKKSADQVIAMVCTKYLLSAEQTKAIKDCELPPAHEPEDDSAEAGQ